LKYFHPEPSGQDWDKKLLEDFDRVKRCSSDLEFNFIISSLIHDLGRFTPKDRLISDTLTFKESFEWMGSSLISGENKQALTHLRHHKPTFKNKYIKGTVVGNPEVINEMDHGPYASSPSIQFLALTRYWNIINYFCPNRDLIPRDWSTVYKEHVPGFINATTYEDYYFAVCRITAEIRDGHGSVIADKNPMRDHRSVPFHCVHVSGGYYISIVWQDSLGSYDLKRMDRVIAMDGIPIEERIEQIGTIISTSNDYVLSKATNYLRLSEKDSVSITVERDGAVLHVVVPTIDKETFMKRYAQNRPTDPPRPFGFRTDPISGKEYLFIDMGELQRSDITSAFKRNVHSAEQLVIDCRNYPNWTFIDLTKVLIKGRRKFAHFKKMNFDQPGSFAWKQSQNIGNRRKGYEGDVYVLVDHYTMSHAEYTVMALQQHPNAVVIGGQTAGADGNVSAIPLPFGITSVFSGIGVFYPDGTPTQQVGVRRDHHLVQDKSHVEERKDLILEKALELMRQKTAKNTP
jgi:carboxyl-terminal processing protease